MGIVAVVPLRANFDVRYIMARIHVTEMIHGTAERIVDRRHSNWSVGRVVASCYLAPVFASECVINKGEGK